MDVAAPAIMEPSELGRVLRKRRELLQLSRGDLALRSGVKETTINKIERGDRDPRYSTLINLARGLGMDNLTPAWTIRR